jgi:CubicO group peptidase (beta-lactamase class C family)
MVETRIVSEYDAAAMSRRCFLLLWMVAFAALPAAQESDYGLESRAAIGAHHICSGLWVVGRVTPRSQAQIIMQDIRPFRDFSWDDRFSVSVSDQKTVTVRGPGIAPRTAVYNGDQGCTILPRGETSIHFKPIPVPRNLPDAATTPWPMGDAEAMTAKNDGVEAALDWGFAQKEHNTRAIVIVHHGKIVGERYAPGWTKDTPQISWSAGKSITAALIGIIVQRGELTVDEFAPIKEWHMSKEDPRGQIRVRDLLHMSSGLDFANLGLNGVESFTKDNKHMRIYFDGLNVFEHAVNQPQEIAPNTQYRYRNSDPLTLGRIVKEKVEARGENYLTFPQRALFDKIGARNFVLETEAWGNFIMTCFDYGSAHDWARFGLLHLWNGKWNGEQILPANWLEFVSTPAPADQAKGYGGLWWLNRGGQWKGVPEDAIRASGHMGQFTMVIPSRDAVIVRLGPSPRGSDAYFAEIVSRALAALPQ